MNETREPASKPTSLIGLIGALLVRLIIPAWIFVGAFTKVQGATPKSLPRSILDGGGMLGFEDHHLLLLVLIAIEFFFVAVMLFIPRLARLAAVTMLSTFLAVLCIEMFVYGNYESCGCLGEHSLSPVIMFSIDFALLLGVVICKPKEIPCPISSGNRGIIGAVLFILLSWGYTTNSILSAKQNASGTNTNLPASWYPEKLYTWVGKSVDDIELFSWVQWPEDIHEGKQYLIFYGRACDHCEALLYMHFEFDLRAPTTLVAIPEAKGGFIGDGEFNNPCMECSETELPIGVDWIIGTPMVIAVEDGIIRCAIEGEESESPACLIW